MLARTWDPFTDFANLQNEMNHLFDGRYARNRHSTGPAEGMDRATWQPPVDIFEDAERIVVTSDLPGVEQKDVDIRLENGILTLRGERRVENPEKPEGFLRTERVRGTFARSFSVPNLIDAEKITANMKNGVLVLTLPKRPEAQPRQIKVKVGE